MGISTTASQTAALWRQRGAKFNDMVKAALQTLVIEVNRKQIANLSGSGSAKPGSYPVPVRRGTLRRSADWGFLGGLVAFVTAGGAQAPYAVAIHEGLGTSGRHGRRPFHDDAVRDTDGLAVMTGAIQVFG